MSQTSTDRLREYLAQFPPQSQALLMREYSAHRAQGRRRGRQFVLEQLRKVVRGAEVNKKCGRVSTIRRAWCFRRWSRSWSKAYPMRPGQIRRASLQAVWQWLERESATDAAREFENAINDARRVARTPASKPPPEVPGGRGRDDPQGPGPGTGPRPQRALARIGPPNAVEDLPGIGAVLRCARGARCFGSQDPQRAAQSLGNSQIATVNAALNTPALVTPQVLPFALSLLMQRLSAPWQVIRLAIKMAASNNKIRVAATSYGVAVTMAIHDLSRASPPPCAPTSGAATSPASPNISRPCMTGFAGCAPNSTCAMTSTWGRQLASLRIDISSTVQSEIDSVPGRVRRLLRQRPDKDIAASTGDR